MSSAPEPDSLLEELSSHSARKPHDLQGSRQRVRELWVRLSQHSSVQPVSGTEWTILREHLLNLDQVLDVLVRHYRGSPPLDSAKIERIEAFLKGIYDDLDIYYMGRDCLLQKINFKQWKRLSNSSDALFDKYSAMIWSLASYRDAVLKAEETDRWSQDLYRRGQTFIGALADFQALFEGNVAAIRLSLQE